MKITLVQASIVSGVFGLAGLAFGFALGYGARAALAALGG